MTSNKFYRDMYDHPHGDKTVTPDLFNVYLSGGQGTGLQGCMYNTMLKGREFLPLSGFEPYIHFDEEELLSVNINSGVGISNGEIVYINAYNNSRYFEDEYFGTYEIINNQIVYTSGYCDADNSNGIVTPDIKITGQYLLYWLVFGNGVEQFELTPSLPIYSGSTYYLGSDLDISNASIKTDYTIIRPKNTDSVTFTYVNHPQFLTGYGPRINLSQNNCVIDIISGFTVKGNTYFNYAPMTIKDIKTTNSYPTYISNGNDRLVYINSSGAMFNYFASEASPALPGDNIYLGGNWTSLVLCSTLPNNISIHGTKGINMQLTTSLTASGLLIEGVHLTSQFNDFLKLIGEDITVKDCLIEAGISMGATQLNQYGLQLVGKNIHLYGNKINITSDLPDWNPAARNMNFFYISGQDTNIHHNKISILTTINDDTMFEDEDDRTINGVYYETGKNHIFSNNNYTFSGLIEYVGFCNSVNNALSASGITGLLLDGNILNHTIDSTIGGRSSWSRAFYFANDDRISLTNNINNLSIAGTYAGGFSISESNNFVTGFNNPIFSQL